MASIEFSQQIRQGVEALRAEDGSEVQAGCRAGDLKGLLNAIADQISEADRRHSDTLQQLQERLAGIGREAKAIKPRVPDTFAAAFERIEAGMSELATRITEASDARGDGFSPFAAPGNAFISNAFDDAAQRNAVAQTPVPAPASADTYAAPPAALRSASETSAAATRRREEAASRAHAGVDTFDVIESMPGNVSDPWDRDAAEALTGHYESGAAGYLAKTLANEMPQLNDVRAPVAAFAHMQSHADAVAGVDHVWLEARFAEISKRIDESISEIRPDQGFFALGQRVEQFEQHFSGLFDSVATKGDVEGIRLIEAHVSELAGHLENAHQQLMRLDAIEDHLAGIAGKLDDVHRAAELSANDMAAPLMQQPEIDMDHVARMAAEAAAQQFVKLQPATPPQQDTHEVRDMLRGFIAESRQGEENTTALLDTLQQAMIRLLDRVDAMELNALQSAQAHAQSAPQEYVREQVRFGVDPVRGQSHGHSHNDGEPAGALDAAVAAVASAKTMASPFSQAPGSSEFGGPMGSHMTDVHTAAPQPAEMRSSDKMRQDFIAEARRAKMRLAAEGAADAGGVTINRPGLDVAAEPVKTAPQAARGAGKAAAKPPVASAMAPRLKVLALGGILALAGAWYVMKFGPGGDQPLPAAVSTAAPKKNSLAADAAKTGASKTAGDAATPTDPVSGKPEGGADQITIQPGTRGEIITDELTVGSTSVPLYGVTVDSEKPMTANDVARAKRQQAMAAVSEQLGHAATENPAAIALPAALQTNTAADAGLAGDQGTTNVAKGSMSQSSALDLPPVTVGPLSLRLAAANGDPSAEFEVGARLAEGKGTDQSFKDAAKWYQRSASHGFAQAQYRLGTLYERGLGLKPDQARAEDWYKRAAEQGNVKAMHNLAVLSANQSKGSPDYVTAASWFEKAAEMGLSDSQFNLAVLHENGLGVTQDLVTAYKWLSLAAKGGDKEAIRRRDILQGKLTGEQIAKADTLLANWKAKPTDAQVNDPRKAGEAWKKNPANGVNG